MYKKIFKRVFDILFSLIVLPFFVVLLLLFAPIIYFSDRGSVFYTSQRIGRNARKFSMLKFRTMKMNVPDLRNEDGSTYNSDNDPRQTRFGKFLRKTSLDEIPQVLNVLIGDMSIIGPRPILVSQLEHYDLAMEIKFLVRPGISGYAQVNGRNIISWEEKDNLDRYYAQKVSFWLDTKIFFQTIIKVFVREGVNKK